VKNPSYQICINICKSRLVYFTSILQNNWLKIIVKNLFCQKILVKSYKYVCMYEPCMVAHACNSATGRQGFRGVWRYLGIIPQGAWASCDRGDGA
jgi:hypothetical protein